MVKQKDILFEDEYVIQMKQWYGPNAPNSSRPLENEFWMLLSCFILAKSLYTKQVRLGNMNIILCVLEMHCFWVDIKAAYIEKAAAFHVAFFLVPFFPGILNDSTRGVLLVLSYGPMWLSHSWTHNNCGYPHKNRPAKTLAYMGEVLSRPYPLMRGYWQFSTVERERISLVWGCGHW